MGYCLHPHHGILHPAVFVCSDGGGGIVHVNRASD